jgi:hypothetical protein
MKVNEALWERIVRIIVGLFLITLTFWGPESAWGWLGLIPLLTGVFGFCPLYALVGSPTCKQKLSPDDV